jgi:hypothetical protein
MTVVVADHLKLPALRAPLLTRAGAPKLFYALIEALLRGVLIGRKGQCSLNALFETQSTNY